TPPDEVSAECKPDRHFEKLNDQFCSGHFAIVVVRAAPASLDHLVAAIRRTAVMEYRSELPDHSGLMPADLITLAHFSVSSAISLLKSAGEPASPVPPRSASRALMLGSARPALISLLSLSTISAGVFLGAPIPYQTLAS